MHCCGGIEIGGRPKMLSRRRRRSVDGGGRVLRRTEQEIRVAIRGGMEGG